MLKDLPRVRIPELMDDPNLDDSKHYHALRGLSRINAFGGLSVLFEPIHALAKEIKNRPIRVLDIATGGGDVPLYLDRKATSLGIPMRADGCDISERAIAYATRRAEKKGSSAQFFKLDVLNDPLPLGYDVITTSLFTHHLDPEQVEQLLGKMATAAGKLVIVNDLLRSQWNLMLVRFVVRALSSCDVVHHDGPASVKAAYTLQEVEEMALRAGLKQSQVNERFPCRFLLLWRKYANRSY